MEDIKARGIEENHLLISDGLKGITDRIFEVFPDAQYQSCCVHLSRNIAHKVRETDRLEICEDFKLVYRSENREMGEKALEDFFKTWKPTYTKVTDFSQMTPKEIMDFLLVFYQVPRKVLNYNTPFEVFMNSLPCST